MKRIAVPAVPLSGAPQTKPEQFKQVVETLLAADNNLLEDFQALDRGLKLGEKRTEPAVIAKALDDAQANWRSAHRLYVQAKYEYESWSLSSQLERADMRDAAHAVLQEEKKRGKRTKMITDADVRDQSARQFGAKWIDLELENTKLLLALQNVENLLRAWESRCSTLQTLLSKRPL